MIKQLIENIGNEEIVSFFQANSDSFSPEFEDYSEFADDDICKSLNKLGEITLDYKRVIVLSGEINGELSRLRSKRKQYEIAKKAVKKNHYDAGIFVFMDNEGRFRFSLITAHYIGTKREFGTYKRYTYFVDPALPNKTFYNQIGKADFSSIENILRAFSIDEVTDDFYKEFKPKFDRIASSIETKEEGQLKEDFALLFVIRIIFLGFVQKKGWLGDDKEFIQNFWKEYKDQFYGQDKFYNNWLKPFFFEALNKPYGQIVKYQNNPFSKKVQDILQMSPYLNGELFKKKKGVDDKGLYIPDEKIDEFLEFLFGYNFTIEENTNYDEELELNPEFLGIIFERLVNKKDGSVYTPRTEVNLMCRLSLVKWLEKNSDIDKKDLFRFIFRDGGADEEYDEEQKQGDFSTSDIKELIELFNRLKVCDPAAGSGAFEVGMMQVLNELLENLENRHNCPPEFKTESHIRKKRIIENSLYGVEVKRWAVWINQLRLWLSLFIDLPEEEKASYKPLLPSLNFKVRRGDSIVQRIGDKIIPIHMKGNADFTSSLKAEATKLKKLKRDFFENKGVKYDEIVAKENQLFLKFIDEQMEQKRKDLRGLGEIREREQFSLIENDIKQVKKDNQLLQKDIDKLNQELDELEQERDSFKEEHPLMWAVEFGEIFYENDGFDIIIGNPPYLRQEQISDPNEYVKTSKEYKDLLAETINLDYPDYFKKGKKINKKSDLLTYFYLHTLKLLNKNGIHCFITSNSWLDVEYGAWVQEFLLNNVKVHFVIDNHAKRSFASADVNTIITIMDSPNKVSKDEILKFIAFKKPFEEAVITENIVDIDKAEEVFKNDDLRVYPISYEKLLTEGSDNEDTTLTEPKYIGDKWGGKYLRAPDIFFTILEKGKDKLVKLKDVADVRFGIKTGCNEFFYLSDEKAKEWGIEEEFLKPVIKSPRECKSILVNPDDLKFKVFMCNKAKDELQGTNALKYIECGEQAEIEIKQGKDKGKIIKGFQNISSVKGRKLWWSLPTDFGAKLFIQMTFNEQFPIYCTEKEALVDARLYEIKSSDSKNICMSLNSTITAMNIELMGRANLGEGGLDFKVYEANEILLVEKLNFKSLDIFNRKPQSIFIECGIDPKSNIPIEQQEPNPLPDRKQLDDIVFDALNLTQEERKEIYRSTCRLVYNRINKAKSV